MEAARSAQVGPEPADAPQVASAESLEARVERLRRAARMLDSRWRIPGTGVSVGLDALVGLLPGIGDLATTGASIWLVEEARRVGVRRGALARMWINVGADLLLGAVPIVGDALDVFLRANSRNVRILERELAATRSSTSFEGTRS